MTVPPIPTRRLQATAAKRPDEASATVRTMQATSASPGGSQLTQASFSLRAPIGRRARPTGRAPSPDRISVLPPPTSRVQREVSPSSTRALVATSVAVSDLLVRQLRAEARDAGLE